jgi:hypothetical protein
MNILLDLVGLDTQGSNRPEKHLKQDSMSFYQFRASGLVVMTSRLQRGDRLFNSGLAHFFSSMINGFKSVLFSCLWISLHRSS